MTRPPKETFGADVQGWLDELGDAPAGDFCDVLRRAEGLPGAQLSAQDIEDVSRLPADEDELRARVNFGTIEDFLDAATAFVAEQGTQDAPAMRGAAPGRRGWAWLGAGLAAVAAVAAVVVWWSLPRDALEPGEDDSAYAAAADRSESSAPKQEVDRRAAPRQASPPAPPPAPPVDPPVRLEPDAALAVPDAATPTAPRVRPRASIEALDAEARAAWKSGELDRARRLFERVVSRGRGGERADVAYGDLFILARQQGDRAGLRRYWKRYVQRFPSGLYIDDARAGLCRDASGDARTQCWQRYLEARPRGTYREDAQAALRTP